MNFDDKPPLDEYSTQRRGLFGALFLPIVIAVSLGILLGFLLGRTTASRQAAPTAPAIAEVTTQVTIVPPPTASPVPSATNEPPPTPEMIVEPSQEPAPTSAPPTITPAPTEAVPTTEPGESPIEDADLSKLFEVWNLIANQFDGSIPAGPEVLDSAIAGSLETLGDEFTRYVPADVVERMRANEGPVEGIGALVRENDDGLIEIVRPLDGQPADLAGLKAGDIILTVDGESIEGQTLDEVVLKVRGPEGTPVRLTVQREGEEEPLEFTIVRTRFEVPLVEAEILPADVTGGAPIAYLHLSEFDEGASGSLRQALDSLLAQNPAGLIFDLRDNPGGLLNQSVSVADAFLPAGVVLRERNIRGLDEVFQTDDGDQGETIPMVVLINAGSASASEIVAGAIQDRGRAVLIGETSFGKGSVQQVYTLQDGSELRVTIARWYTPNDKSIDSEGIIPDIEVVGEGDLGEANDTQLQRAVQYLLTGQ